MIGKSGLAGKMLVSTVQLLSNSFIVIEGLLGRANSSLHGISK